MKKTASLLLIFAALSLASTVYAELPESPEPAEEIIAETNPQAHAIDAYQLLEDALKSNYSGGYPDHYAGCWLDGAVLHVGITSADEETLAEYLAVLESAECEFAFDRFTYSWNQLLVFSDDIWNEGASDGTDIASVYSISSSGIDTSSNRVEVTSENGYSDELYDALLALAESRGMGPDAFYLEKEGMTVTAEAAAEEIPSPAEAQPALEIPVGISLNPLRAYFNEQYGENVYPDHYAGCWYESTAALPASESDSDGEEIMEMSGGLVLHIMLTEDVAEETLDIYREICMREAAFIGDLDYSVVFDRAGFSMNQLRYALEEANARYEARTGLSVTGRIFEEQNRVYLYTEAFTGDLAAVVDEISDELGGSHTLFIVKEVESETAVPQTGVGEVLPEFAEIEDAESSTSDKRITDFYFNPLAEYFESEYGEGVYPDDYAGCWFFNRFDMHIMLTESVSDEARQKYIDIACVSHVGIITVEIVKFSMNQLIQALDEVKSRFGDEYGIGKVHGKIDEAYNRIELTVNYLDEEREEILSAIASELGEAEWVRLFAVSEPADEHPSADCDGPPENYVPVSVYSNPINEYAHINHVYPDYYAGHTYHFGDLTVYMAEGAGENAFDELYALFGGQVNTETRKYSYNTLLTAFDEILKESDQKVWGGIDVKNNCALIHTLEPFIEIRNICRDIADSLGADEDIFDLRSSTYPDTTAELFITESGRPSDAAAELLDRWESSLLNPPHDYLGYSNALSGTIVIKVTKNDEETFDKFRSIVSAADCDIEFETVNNSAVKMEAYRDLLEKQIGYYDKNPYKIHALGISDEGDGYVYILREKYVMGEDTTDELAEYIENIMRTHRHFDDCEVRILEYTSTPASFDYLRDHDSEVFFAAESLALPAAEPQTSPETSDPAGILCLIFSAFAAVGICLTKRSR